MQRTRLWELSEEVWERAEPMLPAPQPRPKGGRPPRTDREMLGAQWPLRRSWHLAERRCLSSLISSGFLAP